jgi:protein-tyrosine phosphatase
MIDFHCHILPGLDDGAATLADALEMARLLAASGFTRVCCTSHHMRGAWDIPAARVLDAVKSLQDELDRSGISLQLLPGREYYLDEFLLSDLDDPMLLPGGRLLVEFPGRFDPEQARNTLYQLKRRKIVPLIAHPERTSQLALPEARRSGLIAGIGALFTTKNKAPDPPAVGSLLTYLQEIGCGFQGNLGSFAGFYGDQVRRNAVALLQAGVYTHLGSDAHSPGTLASMLSRGVDMIRSIAGAEETDRLFGV